MNNFYLNPIKQKGREQELLCVLEEYFNRSHQFRFDADGEISAFVYSHANGEPVLEVLLSKKGKITAIVSLLSDQEIKALERQIKQTLLDDNGDKVGQVICFLNGTVETYYRCDHFQTLPVPARAPKSQTLANSPFLLQFVYPTSPNWRIDTMRRMEHEQRCINLLTLFLHTHITTNPPSSLSWTRAVQGQKSDQRFLGYYYEDFSPSIDAFSDTSEFQENTPIPARDYYTGILAFRNVSIAGQHELRIPDNLCLSFDKVCSLSEIDRENFFNACYWLRQAQTQLPISQSLSLVALITAIECLIGKKRCPSCGQERVIATSRCEECSEPIYKITEAFKQFVEKWLPEAARDPKVLSLLYNTRSSLVHGSAILLRDSHPWIDFMENKQAFGEYGIYEQAYLLTKILLHSWLYGK